jgi:hypothetical protein
MTQYFTGRQSVLEHVPQSELEQLWRGLAETFGIDWLTGSNDYPIQRLWQRPDALATNELYTLACSVQAFRDLAPDWLEHQRQSIVGADQNNSRGALFELIGLSLFCGESQTVVPAVRSQAGYDGFVKFASGDGLRLSLKSYGLSVHNQIVVNEASRVEQNIVERMRATGDHALEAFIDIPHRHPDARDWSLLHEGIDQIFGLYRRTAAMWVLDDDNWFVAFRPMAEVDRQLHRRSASYKLILCAPYHQNERRNLISKLEEACSNLERAGVAETGSIRNAVLVRLPWTASTRLCTEWTDDYLRERPAAPISAVVFIQPSVIRNDQGASLIHACVSTVTRPSYATWHSRQPAKLTLTLPVGTVGPNQSEVQLRLGKRVVGVEDRFIFQRGHRYEVWPRNDDGELVADLRSPASGVMTHAVIEPFPGAGEIILSGRFAPSDELLII